MNLVAFVVMSADCKELSTKDYFKKSNLKLKNTLDHYKCPGTYVVVSSIPKNHNGKKIRKLVPENLCCETIFV